MEPLIAPVLDFPHGFQIQSESLAGTLSYLCVMIPKVTYLFHQQREVYAA